MQVIAILSVAILPTAICKGIDYLPEPENSLKHRLRHKVGLNFGLATHCDTVSGLRANGLRCHICGKMSCIGNEKESLNNVEDPRELESRLLRKEWYNRWGSKNYDSYLAWASSRITN